MNCAGTEVPNSAPHTSKPHSDSQWASQWPEPQPEPLGYGHSSSVHTVQLVPLGLWLPLG